MTALENPPDFFNGVRAGLFSGRMSKDQVAGCDAVLLACGAVNWSTAWTAYALATAFHETNATMQPVREAYWLSEDWRKKHLRYWPFYGRGYVQLTWQKNYERADKELGLDGGLLANLDLAMEPDIAAQIMVKGMAEGWFADDHYGPLSLDRYLPAQKGTLTQFTAARRIINGTDRAAKVAGDALDFQSALGMGRWV